MRASCSLANFAFRCRCWIVCACINETRDRRLA
jgi:hypothetical protein